MRFIIAFSISGRHLAWLGALALVAACGGNVDVNGGSGGAGGTGAGTGTTTGTGTGTGTTTGTGTGTTTGAGGAGGSSCDGLGQVACLGAYPSCVPVYDDACCPSCDPGGCADCIDLQFHHCAPLDASCGPNPSVPCGIVPDWACAGGQPLCGDPGGSPSLCGTVAGCTPSYCPLNVTCDQDPICAPVLAGACTNQCDSVPPPCPDGTIAESDGFCYTGKCIPAALCGG